MVSVKKKTKADIRRENQRNLLFQDTPSSALWTSSNMGWCLTPRTMPLVLHAIRVLSKGSSAAETYFALWCNCISESIVEMTNRHNLISAAGYSGHTSERTWKERMKKLEELGFIKIASGKHGDISSVLILNPHLVLKRHKEQKTANFDKQLNQIYNCILELMAEYGMLDFEEKPTAAALEKEKAENEEMVKVFEAQIARDVAASKIPTRRKNNFPRK
jgi:hypothetical protein